ncbi:homeobox and leucine zipper encoding a [Osmerus eperlanus]|uniref:homeobox and leucine zipper encoding a n=1 Tax=Osmerus eperlanus TaxID=29151 RepID=UPI002E11889D
MATYSDLNRKTGLAVDMREPLKSDVIQAEGVEKHALPRPSKGSHQPSPNGKTRLSCAADSNSSGGRGGSVSFSTNHNSVVCLPLVSEGLKLVWTQSDQTRELDSIPELVQAFNVFPYPTSREVNALARHCALPLDKVKVWFMVQRIKYGISWASEEIEETRRKLAGPELAGDCAETKGENKMKRKGFEESPKEAEDNDQIEGILLSPHIPQKKSKYETPEHFKPAKTVPCFSSSLPPPEDSYYYRPPADMPGSTAVDTSVDLSDASTQQRRHGRYKKSKAQLAVLRSSFLVENWPAEAELRRLQEETGLSRNDIRKWFSDSRYQLRNGRGLVGVSQGYPHPIVTEAKNEAHQLQPLPLVANKVRTEPNGVEDKSKALGRGGRSNGIKDSHFFQTFLSNSIEAFGERAVGVEVERDEVMEETSVQKDTFKEAEIESEDERPLQLVKVIKETEIPQQLSEGTIPSPSSSPSLSATPPPPTAAPSIRHLSNNSQKSACSAKGNSSHGAQPLSSPLSSPSPALTPAGRPRKTKEQLDILKQHFLTCQWPKSEDYTQLVELTSLPRADVIQWFGDTRYAVKNGQLRWVQGVREQFLAELAMQQNGSGVSNSNGLSGTLRGGGGRKRKSQVSAITSPASTADSPDINPLEVYYRLTGVLQEKDLDSLCKKSRMSYQQVRDWFASQEAVVTEPKSNATD